MVGDMMMEQQQGVEGDAGAGTDTTTTATGGGGVPVRVTDSATMATTAGPGGGAEKNDATYTNNEDARVLKKPVAGADGLVVVGGEQQLENGAVSVSVRDGPDVIKVLGNSVETLKTPFQVNGKTLMPVKTQSEKPDAVSQLVDGYLKSEEDKKLSDEEIAWRLHKELNAGSPVFRTRLQRGSSTRIRSNLSESSLSGSQMDTKKKKTSNVIKEEERGEEGGVVRPDKPGRGRPKQNGTSATGGGSSEKADGAKDRGKRGKKRGPKAANEGVSKQVKTAAAGEGRELATAIDDERGNGVHYKDDDDGSQEGTTDSQNNDSTGKQRHRKGKPAASAVDGSILEHDGESSGPGAAGRKKGGRGRRGRAAPPKIPKLPMVRQGKYWYRARVLEETKEDILVEFAGYEQQIPSTRLPKYCDRVWLGSYKGRDWRYHGEGAWVPKSGVKNRVINPDLFNLPPGKSEGSGAVADEDEKQGRKAVAVDTPSLAGDSTASLEDPKAKKRRRKSTPTKSDSDVDTAKVSRKQKKKSSINDGGINNGDMDDDGSEQKKRRPKRISKKKPIYNDDTYGIQVDIDAEAEHQGWKEIQHNEMDPVGGPKNGYKHSRRKHPTSVLDMELFESLDEREALAALAEMPASPVSIAAPVCESQLTDSREALLEAYTSGKGIKSLKKESLVNGNSKKQGKRLKKVKNTVLKRTYSSESLLVAKQMFGNLLGAIASKMGRNNVLHRSSATSTTWGKSRNNGVLWSPHVWSSGVNPSDSEPAILTVPSSLINDALSRKYCEHNGLVKDTDAKPPVPLFC